MYNIWSPDQLRWVKAYGFFPYTTQFGRDSVINMIPNMTRVADKWQDPSQKTASLTSPKCGIWHAPANKPQLCGLFGTRRLQSMFEGHVSHRHPFISHVFYFPNTSESVTISFGIVFKPVELRSGPFSLCVNFAGCVPAIKLAFIGNKPSLGRGFLRSLPKI